MGGYEITYNFAEAVSVGMYKAGQVFQPLYLCIKRIQLLYLLVQMRLIMGNFEGS